MQTTPATMRRSRPRREPVLLSRVMYAAALAIPASSLGEKLMMRCRQTCRKRRVKCSGTVRGLSMSYSTWYTDAVAFVGTSVRAMRHQASRMLVDRTEAERTCTRSQPAGPLSEAMQSSLRPLPSCARARKHQRSLARLARIAIRISLADNAASQAARKHRRGHRVDADFSKACHL